MKERPIIFNSEMVKAILEGRKTQTRRVIKRQPTSCNPNGEWNHLHIPAADWKEKNVEFYDTGESQWACKYCGNGVWYNGRDCGAIKCPYGQPGDRLWVRETWAHCYSHNMTFYRTQGEKQLESHSGVVWKPSIHMPRWASRILLEITDVRVERLQDISNEDAIAEGLKLDKAFAQNEPANKMSRLYGVENCRGFAASMFAQKIWESINGHGSWNKNPWVWVISFKRLKS